MATSNGGPAFPTEKSIGANKDGTWITEIPGNSGMTLRDYFAAKAMEAWIVTTTKPYMHNQEHQVEMLDVSRVAECAYKQADAMLRAREV